jgi:hypothetical protein
MRVSSIEPVQSEYIRQLALASPALEDQLADIYRVLVAASEGGNSHEKSPLGSARAAYVAHLRESDLPFDQLVADIAAVCACVFLHEIGA